MRVDTRLSLPIVILIFCSLVLPFFEMYHMLFKGENAVVLLEDIQAFLLLFFAVFSYFYMRPVALPKGQKIFWFWAVCWWVVLFGRSTSWGRDYFPEVPKIYFRSISVILILFIVLPLFTSELRAEIATKFRTAILSGWGVVLSFSGLIISDSIEHERYLSAVLFSGNMAGKDTMEELFEFPLIFGLFMIAYGLMKDDKQSVQ